MILYPETALAVKPQDGLECLLTMEMATYLCWYDRPVAGAKLDHLGVMSRALIGTLMNHPNRPWGMVTELAKAMDTSRTTLYTIAERISEGVLVRSNGRRSKQDESSEIVSAPTHPVVNITPDRVKRTVLTNLLPGGMAIRPQQESLRTALDTQRSEGWISELILEAGERAGRKLDEIDLSPLGQVVTARDELYFNDDAFLINVEPRHFVIVGGYVEEGCDSKTWGVALQLDHHTRGLEIIGLAEDGAKMYPASVREAELSIQIQKDVWHIIANSRQAVTDVERIAFRALVRAEKLLRKMNKDGAQEDDTRLNEWLTAEDHAEDLVSLSAEVRNLYGHLCDALELVDWRSGEIRDKEINAWLLQEVLKELRSLDHPRVRKLVTYLEGQQDEMLTFLDWLEIKLHPWQRQLTQHFQHFDEAQYKDEPQRQFFQSTVARAWRLNRAVANGHNSFRSEAEYATALMAELVADDPLALQLAEQLLNILESVVRTSCAAETINSILRPYLFVKRSFQSRKTAQAWLNLFCLWFNMHPLRRSKRRRGDQPMSPYQYAGVQVYTDDGHQTQDWLEAIGYPA